MLRIRRDLEKKVEREQVKIEEFKREISRSEAFIQGLQEALKMLPREGTQDAEASMRTLRPGSNMAQARDALLKEGAPLYIDELLKRMGKEVTKQNRVTVSSSMSNYARKGEVFRRHGPNTFGLIELEGQVLSDDLPPEGFGEDEDEISS